MVFLLTPSGLAVLRGVPCGLPVGGPLALSSTGSDPSLGGPSLAARGAVSFMRASDPGAVPSLFLASPLSSPATGPLLLPVARLGMVVLVLVLVLMLVLVVVHAVCPRAVLASRGCLLLVPLADPGATMGSHLLAL